MKPRSLYLLQVALAVAATVAFVLLSNRQGGLRNGLPPLWPWAR